MSPKLCWKTILCNKISTCLNEGGFQQQRISKVVTSIFTRQCVEVCVPI